MKPISLAIIQHKPIHLQLEASMEKALQLIEESAANGANLIVFGECWLTGYPAWLDHCTEIAVWNNEAVKEAFALMHENSISVDGKEMQALCKTAKQLQITLCIGINEKVLSGIGGGTIYNSFVIINEAGIIANHHRKLVPTFSEKLLYGNGDAVGLKVTDTVWGKLGALICWEHWMPLSRQALHNENELIHIALWPTVHEMHQVASRHYAFEGRCFVIAAGQMMQVKDIPAMLSLPEHLKNNADHYLLNGGSCIISPNGNYLIEPQFNIETIIYYSINDITTAIKEKLTLDTTGHYNRWDIFDFSVERKRKM